MNTAADLEIYETLSRLAPEDRVLAIAKKAVGILGREVDCSQYFAGLRMALSDQPPPYATKYYGELYREAAADEQWMTVSLITNAEREGDGAKRLWSLAACCLDDKERFQLKRHAIDESRHALQYLAMLDIAFPNGVDPGFRATLNALSPGYLPNQKLIAVEGSPYAKIPTIDDFLQMNIAEIRTAIHHLMQRQALSLHSHGSKRLRITRIQQRLLRDELHHVAYTAVTIDRLAQQSAGSISLAELFCKRFYDFNRITTEELGRKRFDCSVSCCAQRTWCRAKVHQQ